MNLVKTFVVQFVMILYFKRLPWCLACITFVDHAFQIGWQNKRPVPPAGMTLKQWDRMLPLITWSRSFYKLIHRRSVQVKNTNRWKITIKLTEIQLNSILLLTLNYKLLLLNWLSNNQFRREQDEALKIFNNRVLAPNLTIIKLSPKIAYFAKILFKVSNVHKIRSM